MMDKVDPIRIVDKDNDETYELDFSRESVAFMERQGFKINGDSFDFPVTNIPRLFYFAFRKNHKKLSQGQTDALLKRLGGMTPKMIERLVLLYNQAALADTLQEDEDLEKNAHMAVEM